MIWNANINTCMYCQFFWILLFSWSRISNVHWSVIISNKIILLLVARIYGHETYPSVWLIQLSSFTRVRRGSGFNQTAFPWNWFLLNYPPTLKESQWCALIPQTHWFDVDVSSHHYIACRVGNQEALVFSYFKKPF